MNNYFGIGLDAKISLEFNNKRDEHPKKCRYDRIYVNIELLCVSMQSLVKFYDFSRFYLKLCQVQWPPNPLL